MKTITGITKAWITGDYYGPAEIARDGPKAVAHLGYSDNDMSSHGWTCIGEAEITLRMVSDDEIISNKVTALRKEIQTVRADAEAKATQLERKVQELLAITNEVQP